MKESIARHLSDLSSSSRKHESRRQSMSLPLGLSRRNSEQQNEIREARKFLKDHVRGDWDYPPLPRFQIPAQKVEDGADEDDEESGEHAGEEGVAGLKYYRPSNHERDDLLHRTPDNLDFEPAGWREREYSSADSNDDDDDDDNAGGVSYGDKSKRSEYKFDSPDSIGEQLSDRKAARKRKRQALLDEEVTWNDGMAHWLARRDVWCGAHTTAQVRALENGQRDPTASSSSPSASASASITSSTRSSTDSSETDAASDPTNTPATTPDLPADPTSEPGIIPTEPPVPPSDILVPLVPPILANHPVRKRITPEVYPEMYSKIILQSRTPSVPINLSTMTRALVQGWKEGGEWPPKPLGAGMMDRRRSGTESSLKHGVKAVGRALRITSDPQVVVPLSNK